MAKVECELITQDAIDVEIGGGLGSVLQVKSLEITENGKSVVTPDSGFDGLQVVEINTNTPENITGVPEAADGISLVQLLCSSASSEITELIDENVGWTMTKSISLPSIFANLKSIILNCSEINKARIDCKGIESISTPVLKLVNTIGDENATFYNVEAEEITINVEEVVKPSPHSRLIQGTTLKRINLPTLKRGNLGGNDTAFVYSPVLEELNMPSVEKIIPNGQNCLVRSDVLKKVVYGKLNSIPDLIYAEASSWGPTKNLIHLEVGEGTYCSLPLSHWSPTTALSERLPEFLSNFKTYIAERLTDKGTGLTLTLSQEVRNAIHAAEDEYGIENIIITQKGWTISPAPN